MTLHYQYARADGHPDWTIGQEDFTTVWNNATDSLRFHKGKGFTISFEGETGPPRKLWEMDERLKNRLDHEKPDGVFRVTSVRDSYTVLFRRHDVPATKAEQLIAAMERRVGLPYVFGGLDCSGLVCVCVQSVTGVILPHQADAIRADSRIQTISPQEAKMGDFLFIDRDSHGVEHHIATLLSKSSPRYPGGLVVWDTQPHSTNSPSGWPTPYLGTGVRVRPAWGGYYDANIASFGRLGAINGAG